MAEARTWLLLAYKVPRNPTASRVYVWRKLKKLGAVALQDAVWALPRTPATLEHFRWLAAEIVEMTGEASLWESRHLLDGQEEALVKEFLAKVEQPYRAIFSSLKAKAPDLPALSRSYQQTLAVDYFKSQWGPKVRAALVAANGEATR